MQDGKDQSPNEQTRLPQKQHIFQNKSHELHMVEVNKLLRTEMMTSESFKVMA